MMMEEEYHQASSINSNDDEGWRKKRAKLVPITIA